jgi:hypothetical protein
VGMTPVHARVLGSARAEPGAGTFGPSAQTHTHTHTQTDRHTHTHHHTIQGHSPCTSRPFHSASGASGTGLRAATPARQRQDRVEPCLDGGLAHALLCVGGSDASPAPASWSSSFFCCPGLSLSIFTCLCSPAQYSCLVPIKPHVCLIPALHSFYNLHIE